MSLPELHFDCDHQVVGPYDVLCGRHKQSSRHVGNRRFRVTVAMNLTRYMEADTKADKSRVILSVIDNVRASGGRFLKWSSKRQAWTELDEKHTREKVGHALRDTAVAKTGKSMSSSSSYSRTSSGRSLMVDDDVSMQSSQGPRGRRSRPLTSPTRLASLKLSPEEVRDILSCPMVIGEGDDDDEFGQLFRGSFIRRSVVTAQDRSLRHARLPSFESSNLILNMAEVELLMAAEEAATSSASLNAKTNPLDHVFDA